MKNIYPKSIRSIADLIKQSIEEKFKIDILDKEYEVICSFIYILLNNIGGKEVQNSMLREILREGNIECSGDIAEN